MALSCVVQEGKDAINSLEVLLFKYTGAYTGSS